MLVVGILSFIVQAIPLAWHAYRWGVGRSYYKDVRHQLENDSKGVAKAAKKGDIEALLERHDRLRPLVLRKALGRLALLLVLPIGGSIFNAVPFDTLPAWDTPLATVDVTESSAIGVFGVLFVLIRNTSLILDDRERRFLELGARLYDHWYWNTVWPLLGRLNEAFEGVSWLEKVPTFEEIAKRELAVLEKAASMRSKAPAKLSLEIRDDHKTEPQVLVFFKGCEVTVHLKNATNISHAFNVRDLSKAIETGSIKAEGKLVPWKEWLVNDSGTTVVRLAAQAEVELKLKPTKHGEFGMFCGDHRSWLNPDHWRAGLVRVLSG